MGEGRRMATSDVVLCACGSFSAAGQTERMSSCKAKGEEFLQPCRNERVSVRYGCTVTDAQSRPSMLRLRVFNRVECYRHPRRAPSRPADGCSAGGSCRCVAFLFWIGFDLDFLRDGGGKSPDRCTSRTAGRVHVPVRLRMQRGFFLKRPLGEAGACSNCAKRDQFCT